MKINNWLLFLAIFLINTTSVAQEDHQNQERICYICQKNRTHPIHDRPYRTFSFKNELPILAGLIGLSTTSLLLKSPSPLTLAEINALNRNDINSFDRFAIS